MRGSKLVKKLKKEEDGTIIVIVALFMTIIMGLAALVLDIGFAYNVKSDLQKDLDSVALAAVRNLPANSTLDQEWIDAKKTAVEYAQSNGISGLTESDIVPVYKNSKIIGLKVSNDVNVNYNFAKVLGYDSGTVSKSSTAELVTVNEMSGLLPIALPQGVLDLIISHKASGTDLKLKFGSDLEMNEDMLKIYSELTNSSGWRGAINFLGDDGKVAAGGSYKDAMESGGFAGFVGYGDIQDVNPGVMNVDSYVTAGQIAYVPVVKAVDGKKDLVVVGFATIKIETINSKIVTASYISSDVVSGSNVSIAGVKLNDYGVKAAKLTN